MEEENKKNKRSNDKLWKFLAIFLSITSFIILGICKYYIENFALTLFILIILTILIIASLMWFGFGLINKFKKFKKKETIEGVPDPINKLEARKIALGLTLNTEFAEYFSGIEEENMYQTGKTKVCSIYELVAIGIFEKKKYNILINLNYPDRFNVLIDSKQSKINRSINGLGVEAIEIPDEEITKIHNPLTGTTSETRITKHKKNKDKEDKKDGDF